MQVGVVFPQTEIGADPGGVRAFAQAAEELGYRHLLAYDHVLGADCPSRPDWPGPYTSEHPFHELFVLFGYLAAVAPELELVAGVLVLPQRQTALVAKQAAEVDLLTGGRLRLGVGLGWNYVEFEALGEDFRNRGRRVEEQIEVLRRLWTEPVVELRRPLAHGFPPPGSTRCRCSGRSRSGSAARPRPAIRRAARLADGFFPQRPLEGGWPATMERFRGLGRGGRARPGVDRGRVADRRLGRDAGRLAAATPRSGARSARPTSRSSMRGGVVGPDAHIEAICESCRRASLARR